MTKHPTPRGTRMQVHVILAGALAALLLGAGPSSAQTVTFEGTGSGPAHEDGGNERFRSFGNTGGQENYLGVANVGLAAQRVAADFSWTKPGDHSVVFQYDAPNDRLISTWTNLTTLATSTIIYPNLAAQMVTFGKVFTPAQFDFLMIEVFNRDSGTTVDFLGVKLDGNPLINPNTATNDFPGPAGNFAGWSVTGANLASGFTLTGTIRLAGPFGGSQELSRVEVKVGHLIPATPTATPTATTTPTVTATATPAVTATATVTPTATTTATATPTTTPGDPGTASPTPQATASPGRPPVNHFECYEVHRPPTNLTGVTLDDAFGSSVATIKKAKRICLPADKNDEDPTAPSDPDHQTYYTIKQTSPKFSRVRGLTIVNQFGSQTMDVVKPDRLMVPTAKSLIGTPVLPRFTVDHFKCYRVARLKFRRTGIKEDDQFGTTTIDLKKPNHLCVPVDKNGEGILDPTQLLMCYLPRITSGTSPATLPPTIFTNNQFGADEFSVYGPRDFCVPSTIP